MASSECKNYHQARRPSYDRAEKAREQLLFGNARVSGPAAQQHLERSKAADEEWRRNNTYTLQSSNTETIIPAPSDSMHGYGDSWFENLNALASEYHRQKAEVPKTRSTLDASSEVTPASHGYGDAWFENLNHQREDFQRRKSEEEQRQSQEQHYYGQTWFGNYEPQWAEWKHIHTGNAIRRTDLEVDSDDESCELGQ